MIEKILEMIFPTCCGLCGKIYSGSICPKCYYNLKNELKFSKENNEDFNIYYIGFYEKTIRKLLLKFKFKECAYLVNTFIDILSKNQKMIKTIKRYDYIIPVPMYTTNKKIRGYNQTELLAKKINDRFNIKCRNDILLKAKQNKRQSQLTEKERIENVKNVYQLKKQEEIKNKNILLLDDIYTTGNTIKACRKELQKAEPKKIDILVMAKRNINML